MRRSHILAASIVVMQADIGSAASRGLVSGHDVATVRIPSQNYQFVNTFRDKDTFDAVEGYTGGPMQGRRISKTYSRCK